MTRSRSLSETLGACVGGLALAVMLFAAPAYAQESPDKLVQKVADEVLQTLRTDPDLRAGSQAKMAQLIEQKVAPHFDFDRITRLAVGRNWRQATPEQQKLLVDNFRSMLLRSYSTAYTAYNNIAIEVKPWRGQPTDDDAQVKTEIKLPGGAPPIAVDYSMTKTPTEWKIYDVTVGGVGLVTTYRTTFADEIRQKGIDGLIKSLQDKNAPPPPGAKKTQ